MKHYILKHFQAIFNVLVVGDILCQVPEIPDDFHFM